ncbi:MAG TPA: hypothetical protein VGF49_08625 [Candidatus Solibacter sp.]|jgi:hypothetical protein
MKTKLRLLAVALIAGGTMFAQSRLSVGVSVGGYGPGACPPPVQHYVQSRDFREDHDRDDRYRNDRSDRARNYDRDDHFRR